MNKGTELTWALGILVGSLVSILAMDVYPGNVFLFFFFCITFLVMWALVWVGPMSYFYLFIATFWLLGFWMKACLHLIIGYDFIEPVGLFDWTAGAWDKAILISSVAGAAALIFRVGQVFFLRNKMNICTIKPRVELVPKWYAKFRRIIWGTAVISVVLVAYINFEFGINQSGMLPMHHLPFKLNAFIAWSIYSGFSLCLATLIWWDLCIGKKFAIIAIIAIIFEGVVGSISILSRSLYVTHVFHYCFSVFFNRKVLIRSYKHAALMLGLFLVGMSIVLVIVADLRRDLFYGDINRHLQPISQGVNTNPHNTSSQTMANPQLLQLLADRWVGLEGVMATSSYRDKGTDLFIEGWLNKPTYETKPVYEKIANSIYIDPDYPDADKYNFLSIPGLVAMLNYSGSSLVVGLGVFILFFLMASGEYFIARKLMNPFILSFYGIYASMMLQQFGGLYINLIQCFEFGSVIILLWFLQSSSTLFTSKGSPL